MANYNRTDTINSLAAAMGVKTVNTYTQSKYNIATGTIYGDGEHAGQSSISSAITYFESMKDKALRSIAPNSKTVAEYYSLAISALKTLQDNTAED